LISDDLPLPERPTIAVTVPGLAVKLTPASAGRDWPG
jgi:hypothetical protein